MLSPARDGGILVRATRRVAPTGITMTMSGGDCFAPAGGGYGETLRRRITAAQGDKELMALSRTNQ